MAPPPPAFGEIIDLSVDHPVPVPMEAEIRAGMDDAGKLGAPLEKDGENSESEDDSGHEVEQVSTWPR